MVWFWNLKISCALRLKNLILIIWFLDTSLKIEYCKDGNCEYLSSNNLSIFFDLNKNCLRAANNKSYFLDDDFESSHLGEDEKLVVSYFIAKPGQIKILKDIDVLNLSRFNSRKSLDFLGEIFSEYLKRFVCSDHLGSEYFLREMFLKYPDIFMEIILRIQLISLKTTSINLLI